MELLLYLDLDGRLELILASRGFENIGVQRQNILGVPHHSSPKVREINETSLFWLVKSHLAAYFFFTKPFFRKQCCDEGRRKRVKRQRRRGGICPLRFFLSIFSQERERKEGKDSMDLSRSLRRTTTTLDALSKHAIFFCREFDSFLPPFLLSTLSLD